MPTGTEPLAVGWHSRARSAPTTCLVPGRVSGLLQGGPSLWAGGVARARVSPALCVYEMWGLRALAAWEEVRPGGAGSKLVLWTSSSLYHRKGLCCKDSQTGADTACSLGETTSKSLWKSVCPSLGPSVCLPVHLHPELVSLSF